MLHIHILITPFSNYKLFLKKHCSTSNYVITAVSLLTFPALAADPSLYHLILKAVLSQSFTHINYTHKVHSI